MSLEKLYTAKDPEADRQNQEFVDKGQAKILTDFGTSAPSGEQNGERIGHAVVGGQKRIYFRCPDGEWCYSVLT